MRPTPVATTAGLPRSLRHGGVILAVLVLLLAVLAPTALAQPPADTPPADPPPDHAAEPAHEHAGGDQGTSEDETDEGETGETGETGEHGADNAQTGEPNERAADNAQTGEPNERANDNARSDESDEGDDEPTQGEDENAAGGEGNRGHVQLSSDGESFPPNNEPHLPCDFFVMFYDLREGTTQATVEFAAQPPSGGPGEVLLTETIDFDQAQQEPGVTFDHAEHYDLEPYVGGLTYHEQQGYHIKLTVTTTPEDVSADQKHHVFWIDCAPAEDEEETSAADLEVTKTVTGEDAPEQGTTFTIAIDCDDNPTQVATLAHGETWTWSEDATDAEGLTEDSTCSVDETATHGADVSVTFNGGDVDEGATLELDEGTNAVVVTNDFPTEGGGGPAAADLTVTKDVTGEGAPAADTAFEITVVCDEVTEVIELTDGQTWSWNDDSDQDDLTEDATCSVEETDAQGATTVTIELDGDEIAPGTDQDLDAGTNAVVVTNDFPAEGGEGGDEVEETEETEETVDVDETEETQEVEETIEVGVLPNEVERPAPTPGAPFAPNPAPVVEQPEEPAAAVQDVTAERLPRTGVSSTALLLLALTLLGSGVVAVRRTRPAAIR